MSTKIIEKKLFFIGILIAAIVAFLDLYSKDVAFRFIDSFDLEYPQIAIFDFFNLVKVWNSGVSFGMFNDLDGGKYIILGINFAIMIVLLVWLWRNKITYLTIAISLVIGGAIGNIVDRIINGAVADFLDFHVAGYHWPAFNLADSAVFLGVALLLLENYFVKPKEEEKNDK
ncbi:MAG: signal peptidase II [Rickettsiales bacterium]|jgi:signal peptidase II